MINNQNLFGDVAVFFRIILLFLATSNPTRIRGVTRSVSARRLEGDGYDAKAKKLYLLLLCQMRDINSMSRGNALAPNRHNSVPCTVRTSRQRSCNQRVGCLQ